MPLVGLDEIEWGKLSDAYGSAKDIPDLLRALDGAETKHAFYQLISELWNHINHQGDHYAVTPACVPFLFQILRIKHLVEQKLDVLISLAELLRTLRHDANKGIILDEAEESKSYFAISIEREYLLSLLSGDNLELQVGSLYVLSFLSQEAERILPTLLGAIEKTSEAQFQASAVWVYAKLAMATAPSQRMRQLSQLEKWTESNVLLVKYAATFGYMLIHGHAIVPEAIKILFAQATATRDWPIKQSSSRELNYLYSELMLFPEEELRKLAEG